MNARKCRKWVRESVKKIERNDSVRSSRTLPVSGRSVSRQPSLSSLCSLGSLSSLGSVTSRKVVIEIDYDAVDETRVMKRKSFGGSDKRRSSARVTYSSEEFHQEDDDYLVHLR